MFRAKNIMKMENLSSQRVRKGIPKIVLNDGSVVYGKITDGSSQVIGVQTSILGLFPIELTSIRDIYFSSVAKKTPNDTDSDILYYKSGDVMKGLIEEFGRGYVRIEHEQLGRKEVLFSELNRISFAILEEVEQKNDFVTHVVGFDDSNLTGNIVKIENDNLTFQLQNYENQLRMSLDAIKYIFFRNGQFVYLSDLPDKLYKIKSVPFFPGSKPKKPVKRDKNYAGNSLRLGGQKFYKGLGVISKTEITIRLDKEYKRFQCHIGIDDEIAALYKKEPHILGGSVIF